jgi:hypothetical protein
MAGEDIEARIYDAIVDHMTLLTITPDDLPLAVAGVPFPKAGQAMPQAWLRLDHMPTTTRQITVGDLGFNRHSGMVQVSVMMPENTELGAALNIAGQVAGHFRRGRDIAGSGGIIVTIWRPPVITEGMQTEGEPGQSPNLMVPVTIYYQCDAPNPT